MSKTQKTKNYYNGIAPGYKELYHKEQIKKISLISNHLPTKGNLLDAGSGAGVLHSFIGNSIEVIAFDLSEELLKQNPFNFKKQGNLENLPFENNSFDTITSFTVIQDVSSKKQAIEELSRVLKPNGKLIISFLKMSSYREEIEKELKTKFKIIEEKEEEKDIILICKNN